MRKLVNQFLYAPDDPPAGGGGDDPGDADDPQADPADDPADPPAPDPEIAALKAQLATLQAQAAQRQAPAASKGEIELIEGTNIPKPQGYDFLGPDAQFDYIATTRAQGMMQMNQAVTREARRIENDAEDWYKPYVQEVIDSTHPQWLAYGANGQGLTDEERKSIHTLAKGKAVDAGKTPTTTTKPVPGASPSAQRTVQTTASSEVEQVLQGIREAGYDKVADSPKIKEILSRP